jgi:hypothetical protein
VRGSNIALVIPTIRENNFRDFLKRWNDIKLFDHVDLIVMEDNPKKTFDLHEICAGWKGSAYWKHLCWEDIENDLGEDSWIIPRRSDTVRSFGYLEAWREGYEYVLTLDDDCYPPTDADGLTYSSGEAFVKEHLKALESRSRWFNTLNEVKPRGIPFYNIGKNDKVIVNHGLWTNVLDYDAPYQLANPIPEVFSFDNRIVPAGLYFPMCGMNVMWKAEVTVLMYHLLMGQVVLNSGKTIKSIGEGGVNREVKLEKLAFDRFGDIWCGIFMKKIADIKRAHVSTGMPYIRHERASNPFTNLKKEANGIEVNEKLWEYVDQFWCTQNCTWAEAYSMLGEYIVNFNAYPEHTEYFVKLGKAMQVWAKYLGK